MPVSDAAPLHACDPFGLRDEVAPSHFLDHSVEPASFDDPQKPLRQKGEVKFGADLRPWQPKDEFDPEMFNRRRARKPRQSGATTAVGPPALRNNLRAACVDGRATRSRLRSQSSRALLRSIRRPSVPPWLPQLQLPVEQPPLSCRRRRCSCRGSALSQGLQAPQLLAEPVRPQPHAAVGDRAVVVVTGAAAAAAAAGKRERGSQDERQQQVA